VLVLMSTIASCAGLRSVSRCVAAATAENREGRE
jgi:hypothetical protein